MVSEPAKLLVVDDNPVVLLAISELLKSAGHQVLSASRADEAFRLAREHLPDLILLDVLLPDENGIQLCSRIKSVPEMRSLFVVLLSGAETSSQSQISGLDAGADGYITRPIENLELLARVQSLLRIQQAECALRRAHAELERRVAERTTELARANSALRAMSLRLVEVQETERRFLARELHDEIGQMLTAAKLAIERAAKQTPPAGQETLHHALTALDDLTNRVRRLSLDLRPQMLDDLGLLTALHWHIDQFTQQTGICIRFQHRWLAERLPGALETALYRIVQEALTNLARHARVKEAAVQLWADAKGAGVSIEDKGRGFDAALVLAARTSSGLAGMRERAELLGGQFTLETAPGHGTRLTVELPLNEPTTDSHD